MMATSLKNIFLRPAETPLTTEPLPVIVAAPPEVCQAFLRLGTVTGAVQVVTTTRDAADLPDDVRRFKPKVLPKYYFSDS
jgi:hypothetical protein